jgi:hypothetical protein
MGKVDKEDNINFIYYGTGYFPDGRPVPDLLTEEEAIQFLRLDTDGPTDPARTLKHYRDKGLLKPTRIGKKNRYSLKELLRFIDDMTVRAKK